MKMPKKRWLLSLFALILGISLVGVANAATPQSWVDMMKNDPNPTYMNMNINNQQPTQSNKPAKTNQPVVSQNTSQQAQAKPTDLYNQMLQLCQQVGYPMMQNCPMLNGSQMTREQMIKYCLSNYNQIVKQQPNGQISQQNWQAMQQMCQQWYSKYYPQSQKSTSNVSASQNTNYQYSNNWNNNMNRNWSNNNWNRGGNGNWGYCGW